MAAKVCGREALDPVGDMKHRILTLASCAVLGACAAGRDQQPLPPRAALNVFISPAGEPFRGGAAGAYPVDAWFNRADIDHDGALSLKEFEADAASFFHRLDLNGDGVVDGAEISVYEQDTAPEILPRVARLTARDISPLPGTRANAKDIEDSERPVRMGGGRRLNGAASFSLTPEPEPVAAADTDFDGKVTQAEFLAAARRHFAALDLNKDGRLTRAELPSTPAEKLAAKAGEKRRKEQR